MGYRELFSPFVLPFCKFMKLVPLLSASILILFLLDSSMIFASILGSGECWSSDFPLDRKKKNVGQV